MNQKTTKSVDEVTVNPSSEPFDQVNRRAILRGVMLASLLLGGLTLGGIGIAWLVQGPLVYQRTNETVRARVIANKAGAMNEHLHATQQLEPDRTDQRHWLVLDFEDCPGARQGIWIPDAPKKNAKQASTIQKLRECYLPFKDGDALTVEVETRLRKSSGEKSWRINRIGGCNAEPLSTLFYTTATGRRCSWM